MADNFDIKNFLFENKLGAYSKLKTEGEAAYEYEKGKAAGEKLAKEDMGHDIEDAEAMKQMDFLAEYEVIYVYGEDGKCYRKDDEGNYDQVDRSYCQRYAGSGVREEKEMDFLAEDFKYFDNKEDFEKDLFDKWPEAKKYKEEYEDGRILYSDGRVTWGVWDPNRPNTPSGKPPGAVNQNVGMTARDIMYPDPKGNKMDENIEEAMNNPLLQQVEKAMSALEILHSNTSTNSEIPTVSKEGLLRAFDALSDMLEVIASNIEQDEEEYVSDYSKRRAQELDEAEHPEGDALVKRFLQGIAKKYDYSEKDAAYFVKERLKKLGY
jgi:hypothetical protein